MIKSLLVFLWNVLSRTATFDFLLSKHMLKSWHSYLSNFFWYSTLRWTFVSNMRVCKPLTGTTSARIRPPEAPDSLRHQRSHAVVGSALHRGGGARRERACFTWPNHITRKLRTPALSASLSALRLWQDVSGSPVLPSPWRKTHFSSESCLLLLPKVSERSPRPDGAFCLLSGKWGKTVPPHHAVRGCAVWNPLCRGKSPYRDSTFNNWSSLFLCTCLLV